MAEHSEEIVQPARWVAPWTPEQMRALAMWQYGGEFHPYTCPNRNDGEHLDESVLMPSEHGWMCAWCDYTQTWALDPGDLSGSHARR